MGSELYGHYEAINMYLLCLAHESVFDLTLLPNDLRIMKVVVDIRGPRVLLRR